MKKDKQVSIVVPNYNGMAFMEPCLRTLLADAPQAEILVVDNGSSDGSCELVAEKFPEVRLLALDKNYGFCRAVNEGIKAATAPFVILLNNDTEVLPGFCEALVNALEADARIFSAAAKMLKLNQPDIIDDAGNYYCALGWAFARGKDKSASLYEEPGEIFAGCGGAVAYRREVFEKIGYFDEQHFAYLEDIDIGYRAQIFGYRNVYEPRAKVLHVGSGTSGSRYNAFKVSLSSRNSVYLAYKNMPLLQLLLNLPFLAVGFAVKFLFFLRKGFGKIYAKGLYEGLLLCKRDRKVKFYWKNLPCYGKIQIALWINIWKRFR